MKKKGSKVKIVTPNGIRYYVYSKERGTGKKLKYVGTLWRVAGIKRYYERKGK